MELFAVEYSSLSVSDLLKMVINYYNLSPDFEIAFLKRGFNDTYLIYSSTNKYILRIYKYNWRSKESITNEVNLLNYLSQNNINVANPIIDKKGDCIQSINAPEGNRHAVLFHFANGNQVRKLTLEQSKLLGIETGKIHVLTQNRVYDECAINYDISVQFENTISTVSPLLIHHKEQLDYLLKLKEEFVTLFNTINPTEIGIGICHGDLQAENFHIEGNKITFFDFDFFGSGALIYDIGVFLWYDQKNKTPEIINAFLKGYHTQRKLMDTELKLIPYFSTLRALFQMTVFCKTNNGKQLPLWPAQQVADFINKVEQWHTKTITKKLFF